MLKAPPVDKIVSIYGINLKTEIFYFYKDSPNGLTKLELDPAVSILPLPCLPSPFHIPSLFPSPFSFPLSPSLFSSAFSFPPPSSISLPSFPPFPLPLPSTFPLRIECISKFFYQLCVFGGAGVSICIAVGTI